MEIDKLTEYHKLNDELIANFIADKEYGFDFDIDRLFMILKTMNPQRFGYRGQRYFCKLLDFKEIPSKLGAGDFLNSLNENVEFKCSFLDVNKRFIHVKHIRPWQPLNYFYILAVDFIDYTDIKYDCYVIPADKMAQELILLKATPCNNTAEANQNNKNIELGFSLELGSPDHQRWLKEYHKRNFDFRALSEKKREDWKYIKQLEEIAEIKRKTGQKVVIKPIDRSQMTLDL